MTPTGSLGAPTLPLVFDDLGRHGHAPALVTAAGALTYAELEERVTDTARRLGATRRLVLVAAANTVDAVVAYLAALRGRHVVLLAPGSDPAAIDALSHAYDPDVVATPAVHELRQGSAHRLHPDLALLLSTSGSTGAPKLVRLSHTNLRSNAAAIAEYLALTSDDRAITTLPMQYCYGLSVINSHLHVGASTVLTDLSVVDPCFWDLFRHTGPTSFAGVPHTFDLLDRVGFDGLHLPTLRYLTQAGGRMSADTVRRYAALGEERGWELYVMYGQTEATARMAYLPPQLARSHPHTIGVPIPGGAFTVEAPDDEGVGELVYRGANVMLGYAQASDDLALGRTVDELRTGDLGRITDDGLLEIAGRRSRLIKPFGVRIDLDDLERHLAAAHGCSTFCTGDDEHLVVGIHSTTDAAAVARSLDERLHLPPSRLRIVQVDEPPRLANGKADYDAIRRAAAVESLPAQEHGSTADSLRATFSDLLGVDATDDDSFVSLGGDSLSYVEVSVALEAILGELPRAWHLRSIRELAVLAPRRRRWWASTDTSIVVRAVAIVLVVGSHSRVWHHPGGAHTLLALAGYNFARFRLGGHAMWPSIARIALPSMCWIGIVAAASDGFSWQHALLLNGLVGEPGARWAYWFIEAIVLILVPLALALSVPAVARAERRRPFAFAAVAVIVGLLVRFDIGVDLTTDRPVQRPHEVFWLFALGWAAVRASTTGQRIAVTAAAPLTVIGFFGQIERELIVTAGVLLVLWRATLPVPRLVVGAVTAIASASLYIYLVNFQVYPPVSRTLGPIAALVGSVVAGIAASAAGSHLLALGERGVRARRGAVTHASRATLRATGLRRWRRSWRWRPTA